jgi:hypothetical protein
MNTVGVFAGRGDVILAMGFAVLIGAWVGWQAQRFVAWLRSKRK